MRIEDMDTPFLRLDLDAVEENLDRFQAYFNEHKIGFRPHIKTHKNLAISRMQLDRGAIGLTCQKLGETEVLVAGGLITDYLVPYNIIGKQKLDRLTALARQTKMTVAADSEYTVRGLSQAAEAEGVTVGVLVELEMGRTGVTSSEQAANLGRLIDSLPGIEMRGIMGFPTPPETRERIKEVLDALDGAGLPHPVVSGGSTKCAFQAHEIPELTEYRAGEYPVGGAGHLWEGRHTVEQCAARVVATVVSRPTSKRAILDAGSKAMSGVVRPGPKGDTVGHVVEYPEAHFYSTSEEHGSLDLSDCDRRPEIGERVQVLPVHPCPCINEHDEFVVTRGDKVLGVWPIHARGKVK